MSSPPTPPTRPPIRPPRPPPSESDSGTVLVWSLLGVVYYLLAVAVYAGLLYLLPRDVSSVLWVGTILVPVVAYLSTSLWVGPERRDERRGLGIALALIYGLSCLLPFVICGGMILAESHGHH